MMAVWLLGFLYWPVMHASARQGTFGKAMLGLRGSSASVGRFEAAQPGVHRVAVEGSFERRVMAVGPNRLWPILKLVAEAFVKGWTELNEGRPMPA